MARLVFRSAVVFAFLVALVGTGSAHAVLTHADPAARSTINAPPAEVTIDFSEAVEPRFSSITVQDAQRQRVDTGDVHAAPDDPKRLVVGLKPLQPGIYKVIWHAVSVDTHTSEGVYVFTVAR